ncbi:MAG: hypothetical protein A2437_15465 [Bacteroidetes bacterium RIFOXYC2_FULL_40_12]|nr:MAG: hypothetical protein A2437_15465 [Bacteroidetes bacterium RIFOXYC2_FULL_40_12]
MLLQKHLELYAGFWGTDKNFQILKRFFKIYLNGFPGAGQLRAKLMETRHGNEAQSILEQELHLLPERA